MLAILSIMRSAGVLILFYLQKFLIQQVVTSQIIHDTTFASGVTSYNYNVQVEITNAIPVGAVVKMTFVGITSNQISTTVEKYILVESGMATYTDVVLQGQADGPDPSRNKP